VIKHLAFDDLEEIFYKWSKQHIEIEGSVPRFQGIDIIGVV
jgi:hypothetical protein